MCNLRELACPLLAAEMQRSGRSGAEGLAEAAATLYRRAAGNAALGYRQAALGALLGWFAIDRDGLPELLAEVGRVPRPASP